MSDRYLTDVEAMACGRLAVARIRGLCVGLNAALDNNLLEQASNLEAANQLWGAVQQESAAIAKITFRDQQDATLMAQQSLGRAVSFLKSRSDGASLVVELIGDHTLTEVKALRPAVFVEVLDQASQAFARLAPDLLGSEMVLTDLQQGLEVLRASIQQVRDSQVAVRAVAIKTRKARADWVRTYMLAKQTVRLVLRTVDRMDLLPVVFEDLMLPERRSEPRLVG